MRTSADIDGGCVLRLDDPAAPILGEEIYGPVAPVDPLSDVAEAIAQALGREGGLEGIGEFLGPKTIAFSLSP